MRVAAPKAVWAAGTGAAGYLRDELEAEEGGAVLLEVLFDLQFLTERAIRCHNCNTVACTCRRTEPG